MADLAVAHLAGRQAHVKAGRGKRCMRILGKKPVEYRRVRRTHRIADNIVGQAEAVHDDEGSRSFVHKMISFFAL